MVKVILSILTFVLSLPAADKTQYSAHLSFTSTLQLINSISSDILKLLKYFNGTASFVFFRISLAWFGLDWAFVFANNLVLYSKDLKSSIFQIPIASSFK